MHAKHIWCVQNVVQLAWQLILLCREFRGESSDVMLVNFVLEVNAQAKPICMLPKSSGAKDTIYVSRRDTVCRNVD